MQLSVWQTANNQRSVGLMYRSWLLQLVQSLASLLSQNMVLVRAVVADLAVRLDLEAFRSCSLSFDLLSCHQDLHKL